MRPILEVSHVSKKYRIGHSPGSYHSLRDRIANFFRSDEVTEDFWALKDVSFQVERGQTLGIIGKNGAGKSTLLKILSKIVIPTEGKITSRGRMASLLEVGTGFHAELSGRENIFFNGSILGMKRVEIEKHFDEIVDFAGTEKFLDTPLKHYSSGMQLRLAFAVAAFLEPEILVIDEVLAVGDAEFQRKCMGKMEDVSKSGRTILFVSHDLNAVANLCRRVVVLKSGSIAFDGEANAGIDFYQKGYQRSQSYKVAHAPARKPVYFEEVTVSHADGSPASNFMYNQPIRIDFKIVIRDASAKWDLFVMILDARKRRVFALESSDTSERMSVILEPESLVRGTYSICAFVNQPNIARLDEIDDVCEFEVIDNGSLMLKHGAYDYGSVFGKGRWV